MDPFSGGSRGGSECSNPTLNPHYFIFMRNSKKIGDKL